MGDVTARDPQSDPTSYVWSVFNHETNKATQGDQPPRREREQLGLGDFAALTLVSPSLPDKLGEGVWVRVLERKQATKDGPIVYRGELDTSPRLISGIAAGSPITFGPEHVLQIESTVRRPGGGGGGGGILLLLAAFALGRKRKGRR